MPKVCTHCDEQNLDTLYYCAACGKSLPSEDQAHSQLAMRIEAIEIRAERKSIRMDFAKNQSRAFGVLLAAAILQTLWTLLIAVVVMLHTDDDSVVVIESLIPGIQAVIFYALAFWARSNPLPAAIVGLVLCVSLTGLEIVLNPQSFTSERVYYGIVITIVLIQTVISGVRNHQRAKDASSE